ncbi:hypothetical protein QBC34DRAFT_82111 [Podospora aff. communis PSN243]|uniref:Uncharacterized protein n=1 Tax=Podospora aff. communis PSN243 TaxID=3040156 RepID=A0AAV9GNE5_9PEZI|nr:hypothetical protein QBC34DRAFT_82111 [Podospora aff. communis PSN243]
MAQLAFSVLASSMQSMEKHLPKHGVLAEEWRLRCLKGRSSLVRGISAGQADPGGRSGGQGSSRHFDWPGDPMKVADKKNNFRPASRILSNDKRWMTAAEATCPGKKLAQLVMLCFSARGRCEQPITPASGFALVTHVGTPWAAAPEWLLHWLSARKILLFSPCVKPPPGPAIAGRTLPASTVCLGNHLITAATQSKAPLMTLNEREPGCHGPHLEIGKQAKLGGTTPRWAEPGSPRHRQACCSRPNLDVSGNLQVHNPPRQ